MQVVQVEGNCRQPQALKHMCQQPRQQPVPHCQTSGSRKSQQPDSHWMSSVHWCGSSSVVVVVGGSVVEVVEVVDVVVVDVVEVVVVLVVVVVGKHWLSRQSPSQGPQSSSAPQPSSRAPHWACLLSQLAGWQQVPNFADGVARTQTPEPQFLSDLQRELAGPFPAKARSAARTAVMVTSAARKKVRTAFVFMPRTLRARAAASHEEVLELPWKITKGPDAGTVPGRNPVPSGVEGADGKLSP